MNKNKLIIILVWFLDIISLWIVIPTLPALVEYYHVSEQLITHWITLYALCAFVATPILWQLSDMYWRKKILLLCVIWSFLSSLMIPIFTTYFMFLLARFVNWFTGWNIWILQSIITDISKTKEERMKNMWVIWAMFAWWFIFWPLLWAMLLHFWAMVPYWLMAIFSLIEIIVIVVLFEETNQHIKKRKMKFNLVKQIWSHLKVPRLNYFMISFFLLIAAFNIYQSMIPLYLSKYYWVSWSFSWYVMAASWFILALNQLFLMRWFWLKKFSTNQLIFIINFWLIFFFLLLTFIKPLYLFIWILIFLLPFRALLNPVYQSEIMEYTEIHERWEIMWILTSLQSLWMFIWPLLGWILLDKNISIFGFSALFIALSLALVFKMIKVSDPKEEIAQW
ncbi:MAG: hypothetical protein ACD_3C00209G0002 [uncultured bacterium (gcode 4)]|uniref:Major facilitator superfamily (MFS) profile domain-containing protein n=1 Tax=uncultured bacterium (gcode 4) TaxID=1234023 RepID=K2FZS6_9BACT|nr:MAG: hypothetical protein ACD_3C00209G0002 [uncultured bacterium (gcode 4)]